MSDFVQTMKQWQRMCKSYKACENCPVNNILVFCDDMPWIVDDIPEFEATIMKWAAEHPEPVYPRWVDWLVQVGVLGGETSHGHKHYFVEDDMFEHIPEETAQLLGLKPLPIVNGDCDATNEADARKKLGIQPKEGA